MLVVMGEREASMTGVTTRQAIRSLNTRRPLQNRRLVAVKAILLENDSVDITLRRKEYALSGWEGFDDEYVSDADLADRQ